MFRHVVRRRDLPLVTCPRRELPASIAARWSARDDFVRCDRPLRPPRRGTELLRTSATGVAYAAPASRAPA